MNAIPRDSDQAIPNNREATAASGRGAAQQRRDVGTREVHDLMADVQDLLGQMVHVADPEIARLRARVADALETAKRAVTDSAQRVQRQTKGAIRAGDGYVRNQPWQAVGVAALAGLVVGIVVGRR